MAKCTRTACTNEASEGYKQCLSCRLYMRARQRRRYEESLRTDRAFIKRREKKKEWTQEKWEKFIKEGGLNGL